MRLVRLLAIAGAIVAATAIAAETGTVVEVVDGDTLKVDLGGRIETVRLIGVDTPETVHPQKPVEYFGREATAFTRRMAEGKTVRLEDDPEETNRDGYGRLLRYVWIDDVLLNAEIIAQGYGFVETRFPFVRMEEFRALGREAREAERGLWAPEPATRFTRPDLPVAPPSTIVYVTATGAKYHLEGCRHLARSSIPMLLESAAGQYEPCSVCRPPRM